MSCDTWQTFFYTIKVFNIVEYFEIINSVVYVYINWPPPETLFNLKIFLGIRFCESKPALKIGVGSGFPINLYDNGIDVWVKHTCYIQKIKVIYINRRK